MKGFKKIIAITLLCITLFSTVLNSYSMTVQAAEVAAVPFLESLIELFGISSGLGKQSDFWERAEYFERVVNAAKSGSTYTFSDYGDVDFSDSESIKSWLLWSRSFDTYLRNSTAAGTTYTAAMVTLAKALDAASYKASGTSATTAISNGIQTLIDKAESGTLAEDIQDFFTAISSKDISDLHMDWNKYTLMLGIVGSSLISDSTKLKQYVDALVAPETTVYTDYGTAFEIDIDGYSGSYGAYINPIDTTYSNGEYSVLAISSGKDSTSDGYYIYPTDSLNNNKIFGVQYTNKIEFLIGRNSLTLVRRSWNIDTNVMFNNSGTYYINNSDVKALYIPVFKSIDDGIAYFYENGSEDLILNKADITAYPTFKDSVASPMDTLDATLSSYFDHAPAAVDVQDLVDALIAALPSYVGTAEYVPSITKTFDDVYGGTTADTPADTATGTYSGVLGKILTGILDLPAAVYKLFTNPIAAILDGVLSIFPAVTAIKDAIDVNWKELVAYLEAILAGILALDMTVQFPTDSGDSEESEERPSGGFPSIINGLLLLVYILFMLLRIFLHLLEFIINIFKIPATPGFITGDFATGFEYIKSVQLSPLNISVYDFLMGLIHILLIFGVVKTLKHHIDRIHA